MFIFIYTHIFLVFYSISIDVYVINCFFLASSKKSQAGFFGEKNPFILSNRIEDPIKKLAPKKLTLSAIE